MSINRELPGSSSQQQNEDPEEVFVAPDEAAEEIIDDGDVPIDSDNEDDGETQEVLLQNDSVAYFDQHTDSIYALSTHPNDPAVFISGGGDDKAYIWKFNAEPQPHTQALAVLEGHTDSIIACGFFKPEGNWAWTAGLDGKFRAYKGAKSGWKCEFEAKEVEEVVWAEGHPTMGLVVLGGNDGSCWVYNLDEGEVSMVSSFHGHTMSCTAGVWRGTDVATVSEDGGFFLWDGLSGVGEVGLNAKDARFAVEGGLYSVAVHPSGSIAVVGGATGDIRAVGLPGGGAIPTVGGTTQVATSKRPEKSGGGSTGGGQVGQVIAAVQAHAESVETLSFAKSPTLPLLASGAVDGKIVIYDTSRGFAIRKEIENAHDDAIVKIEFSGRATGDDPSTLTSVGMDGKVKRWDVRSGTEIGTWKGHSEGILCLCLGTESLVATAGDEGVAMIWDAKDIPARS